jgi:NADP-dependent 3-hydroxy acid dehydrogenase YdfG
MKELSATAATSQILIYKEADVSNRGQIFKAIDEAVNILGRLDSIVNVAGIERSNPAEEIPEATIDAVLSVNVKGIILSCQAAFPHLKAAGGGSVINFGSAGGLGPYVGSTCYFGSKD